MLHQPIVIVGGGPVGLSLALALAKQGKKALVIDQNLDKVNDSRVLALSFASQAILTDLAAWPHLEATAIDCVQISHPGLGISNIEACRLKLNHLGYTIKYSALCASLQQQVSQSSLIQLLSAVVVSVNGGGAFASLSYQTQDGRLDYLTADLVIMAEGGKLITSSLHKSQHDYRQQALIAHIRTRQKVTNIAYERFARSGPLVLLPFKEHYVLVWSLPNQLADKLKADADEFLSYLDDEFTSRMGGASLLSPITSYPLKLTQVRQRVLPRVVLVGNSAQTVHPISAQGLNLGLRDMLTLSLLLAKDRQINLLNLRQFDSLRNKDANNVIGFTHFLATVLEQPGKIATHLRGAGIIGLSNLPLVQDYIAKSLIFGR